MRWRLKSSAWRLFTQPFIRAQIRENIKALRLWPLWGEFTGDRWIPRTKGQQRGKYFHLMTSSCIPDVIIYSRWRRYDPSTDHKIKKSGFSFLSDEGSPVCFGLDRLTVRQLLWNWPPVGLKKSVYNGLAANQNSTAHDGVIWCKLFRVTGPLRGESTCHQWLPSQRPVTQSFDVFVNGSRNKQLDKQSNDWLFETSRRSCDVIVVKA